MCTMRFLNVGDWGCCRTTPEQFIRMTVLDQDILSAQIAFEDYKKADKEVVGYFQHNRMALARQVHHAKVFVCAMRRIGRVLESLSSNRDIFPHPVAETIKLTWKSLKSTLYEFKEARNAIEHIDNEIPGKTSWHIMNLYDDGLAASGEKFAPVNINVLERVVKGRNKIVKSLRQHCPGPCTDFPPSN